MTKQEMAEWIAENVLGWEFCGECNLWVREDIPHDTDDPPILIDFIYSPDGFFAVWDAVEEKFKGGQDDYGNFSDSLQSMSFSPKEDGHYCFCVVINYENHYGTGKDRYKAFYNAVYEAMK